MTGRNAAGDMRDAHCNQATAKETQAGGLAPDLTQTGYGATLLLACQSALSLSEQVILSLTLSLTPSLTLLSLVHFCLLSFFLLWLLRRVRQLLPVSARSAVGIVRS